MERAGRDRKSNFTLPLLQHAAMYQHKQTRFSLKYGYAVIRETGMMKKGLVPVEDGGPAQTE